VVDAGLDVQQIAAIGISNQRETTVVWDRRSGKPIHHAIVWQDRRTSAFCDELRQKQLGAMIQQKTGLVIDAYFSASKLGWILDHVPAARDRAARGELAFGTIDSWLLWNLTNQSVHATDVSNASRTMLLNIHTRQWDDELLNLFNMPRTLLPTVRRSCEIYGLSHPDILGAQIPIAALAGDQQAALFGQTCFSAGLAKNTYGTGCFMLMNTAGRVTASTHQLLSTIAWQRGETTDYALEGSVFIGGAVVQWLRDGLGIIKSAAEIESLAASVPDSGGVYLVPAFAGLGAPHWDQYARGIICGITRGTTAAHLARAGLEGITFQVADVLDAMQNDSGVEIKELRVDGGAAADDLLIQFQADIIGVPVVRPKVIETTALGAAYLAGLATGFWKSADDVRANWQIDRTFRPAMSRETALLLKRRWSSALARARDWEEHA
jgi:glycerol kinase